MNQQTQIIAESLTNLKVPLLLLIGIGILLICISKALKLRTPKIKEK